VPTGFLTMGMVLAAVGFARAHLRTGGRWLSYATEAVYPFYIVHQTITVAAVYVLLPRPWGAWPKFALVAAATFAGSWLCFELVRRVPPLRPLFGLKARAGPRPRPE
jgi:surface polysaccharide O-acyltransferase-like enzyme